MYNILVVDDEELICHGMKSMIQRINNPDIKEVYIAQNVYKAEEIINLYQVDIVMTDICMPQISGLDLIQYVKNINSNIKCIALSGYDEFQYVNSAYKLGVEDYLLKPVKIGNLESVLNTTVKLIEIQHQQQEIIEDSKQRFYKASLENKINKLFAMKSVPGSSLIDVFSEYNVIFDKSFFSVALIRFYNMEPFSQMAALHASIQNEILSFKNEKCIDILHLSSYNNDHILIFNHSGIDQKIEISEFLKSLSCNLNNKFAISFTLSLSNVCEQAGSVHFLYKNALKALEYKFFYGLHALIEYAEYMDTTNNPKGLEQHLSQLSESINARNHEKASNIIDTKIDLKYLNLSSLDSVRQLYSAIMHMIEEAKNSFERLYFSNPGRDFNTFSSLPELRDYIKDQILKLCTDNNRNKETTVMRIAQKYIQENYHKNINLASVANTVSMNYSYFSKLFKDETGMNFTDYLMKFRMMEAKRLLDNTTFRIHEISSKVGYDDPKHFTRAFKKYFGVTPRGTQGRNVSSS